MKTRIISIEQRKAALVAGISFVVMSIGAIVSTELSIGGMFVAESALETTKNIMESQLLFRIGIFGWLIILVCDVLATWGLYIFLKPVNKNISLIMAWFRIIYAAVLGASILNLLYVLPLLNGAEYLSVIGTGQIQLKVLLHVTAFYDTLSFGLIVFGIHILLLGWLILKSGYRIRILGILLILAFVGYTITNSSNLLFPQYENIMNIVEWVFMLPMLSEVALGIWLLIIGLKKSFVIKN